MRGTDASRREGGILGKGISKGKNMETQLSCWAPLPCPTQYEVWKVRYLIFCFRKCQEMVRRAGLESMPKKLTS